MDKLEIYVDRLHSEKQESIDVSLSPSFLDIDESKLSFCHPVHITGSAYTTSSDLVMNLSVRAIATLPCIICQEPVELAITLDDFYHTMPLEEIKGGIYNANESVREAVLLEVPQFIECGGKSCPRRHELNKYLTQDDAQFPFAELGE